MRKVLFGFIIVFVVFLVGVLSLTILEHTGVIVWDQTKPGVANYTSWWGQLLAIGLPVLAIVGLSVLRLKVGQASKLNPE
ncbi:MAG: hypothetical protein ACRC1D_06700 [Culicoidibacterales bacterium]